LHALLNESEELRIDSNCSKIDELKSSNWLESKHMMKLRGIYKKN